MRLVLDTNILYGFFWKGSLIKKLLQVDHDLYAPEFALEELEKHKSKILQKTKLLSKEFEEFKEILQKVIEFIPFSAYSESIKEAFELLPDHQKDIDFLALALYLDAAILSKEKKLKKQNRIRIFNETDLSQLLK